jgi:rhodanese-related sulfurtransferase
VILKKVILAFIFSLTSLFADFIDLTPAQLQEKIKSNTVVIDIRTPPEWVQTGVIPTSQKIMFFDERGGYNFEKWLGSFGKYVKNKDQEFVLVCRSGNRTGSVGKVLSQKLGYKKVYHLKHGIKSWIKENRKTVK